MHAKKVDFFFHISPKRSMLVIVVVSSKYLTYTFLIIYNQNIKTRVTYANEELYSAEEPVVRVKQKIVTMDIKLYSTKTVSRILKGYRLSAQIIISLELSPLKLLFLSQLISIPQKYFKELAYIYYDTCF